MSHSSTSEKKLATILLSYQQQIENEIKKNLNHFTPDNTLKEACHYALLNGGKRFRPSLVLMIANALGQGANVTEAALAIEYFHTASLVADDLPCMDDDDERRNVPSTHKVFGEGLALLVTYCLIAEGYRCLAANAETLRHANLPHSTRSDRICTLALESAGINTGLAGATGGQFLDICPPKPLTLNIAKDIIHKKTTTLFEVSFVLGWLYGGGDLASLDAVKAMASHYGMAFQIADDLDDIKQDAINGREINIAALVGKNEAYVIFHEEMANFKRKAEKLGIYSSEIAALAELLLERAARFHASQQI